MLSGRTPFSGDNNLAVMAQHVQGRVEPLNELQPDVSPALAATVARALARNPDERFQDMPAFIDALDHPESVDLSILAKSAAEPANAWWRSSALRAIALGFLLLAALIVLAVLLQSVHQ
jgi:hypothetical protein